MSLQDDRDRLRRFVLRSALVFVGIGLVLFGFLIPTHTVRYEVDAVTGTRRITST